MAIRRAAPASIDEYIAASPSEVQPVLEKIRRIVRIWHGWTTPANADTYEAMLKEEIFVRRVR